MTQFTYDFSDKDRELILNGSNSNELLLEDFSNEGVYFRIIVYPSEGLSNIVRLPALVEGEEQRPAIFYSSLSQNTFKINESPFYSGVSPKTRDVGVESNDFEIFFNQYNNNISIKPNDIFDEYGLPQGNYRLQIDCIN